MTLPAPDSEVFSCDVYISEEERAVLNGDLVPEAEDVPVHEAVLNLLHDYARERDTVVRAAVNDRSSGETFLLDVLPDGSSRLSVPSDDPLPPTASPAPHDATLPPALADRVTTIQRQAHADQLDQALLLATALREYLTGRYEAAHPYALEARALEAYLAHLCGIPRQATLLALAVARVRCQHADPRAADDVARATAAWSFLQDEQPVLAHGTELLNMWQRLGDQGLVPNAHAPLVRYVGQRMRTPPRAYAAQTP
ncbi:hypothetical protein ACIHIX_45885 [Streptomyces sp. NPDC051913]|uniref:hypothetical protein n=1 Tax=Streptomyces sp. NPDC051913 TaxID=3365676 RepID=UPI0037D88A78